MSLVPQKFREIVFQIVYALETSKEKNDSIVPMLMDELEVSKKNIKEAFAKAEQILDSVDSIDERIRQTTVSYEFERIQTVEKNILRLAVFELFYEKQVAAGIVISEAIRLAKKFSTKEAGAFIHAILDAMIKKGQGETVDLELIKKSAQTLEEAEQYISTLQVPKQEEL